VWKRTSGKWGITSVGGENWRSENWGSENWASARLRSASPLDSFLTSPHVMHTKFQVILHFHVHTKPILKIWHVNLTWTNFWMFFLQYASNFIKIGWFWRKLWLSKNPLHWADSPCIFPALSAVYTTNQRKRVVEYFFKYSSRLSVIMRSHHKHISRGCAIGCLPGNRIWIQNHVKN